jgi:hypothetical protein
MNAMAMNAATPRLIVSGLLFAFTLLSGVWLSSLGRPYNTAVFTIHKLIALATVIVIASHVFALYRALDVRTSVVVAVIAATGLLLLALFATGALLSLKPTLPQAVLRVHQVAPFLTLASSALTMYLLVGIRS